MSETGPCPVFDTDLVRRHWARAQSRFSEHRVLFDDAAEQLKERLDEIKRPFQTALDLSPAPFLEAQNGLSVTKADPFPKMENFSLAPQSFDLVVSNFGLHWINDLPGVLRQIRQALKPDGLFLAALIGGETLSELRSCLIEAEIEETGGASPRLSPMIDLYTAGNLLHRAGFKLAAADSETILMMYSDIYALMRDLRGMGQANAQSERLRKPAKRALFARADDLYRERFGDARSRLPARFDLVFLHGWS